MLGAVRLDCRVKHGFFRPEQQSDESNAGNKRTVAQAKTEGWGKIIARLIKANHPPQAIADYTLAQIKIFSKYAEELDREGRANQMVELAIAFGGDKKAIAKKVQELLS